MASRGQRALKGGTVDGCGGRLDSVGTTPLEPPVAGPEGLRDVSESRFKEVMGNP